VTQGAPTRPSLDPRRDPRVGYDAPVLARASARLLALALLIGALLGARPARAEDAYALGVARYGERDYAGALEAFGRALESSRGRRRKAKVRVYIGLIQLQLGASEDALGSFERALDLDPEVRMPAAAPEPARKVFRSLQRRRSPPPKAKPRRRPRVGPDAARAPPPDGSGEVDADDEDEPATTGPEASERPETGGPGSADADADPAAEPVPFAVLPEATVPAEAPVWTRPEPGPAEPSGAVLGWVTVGVGVAALAAGASLLVMARARNQEALDAPVAADAFELHRSAVGLDTGGWVALGSGAALGALGAALLAW
jgi:hypothetical protein